MTIVEGGPELRQRRGLGRARMLRADAPLVDVAGLYASQRLAMVRLAILFVDDLPTAEDVVQDAFVGLHRNRDKIRKPEAAIAYLRASVVNGARSTLRRRRTARNNLAASEPGPAPPADLDVLVADEHREVLGAVRGLPDRQREVLLLRYWSNLSEADIAATLGISVGAVKSNASRGLDNLSKALGGAR